MNESPLYLPFDAIEQLPPLEYRIMHLMERNAILVLGGPPKQGKSRLALNMLWQAIAGQQVLGQFALTKTLFQSALVYNAEGGVRGLQARAGMAACVPAALHGRLIGTDDKPLLMGNTGQLNNAAWLRIEGHVMDAEHATGGKVDVVVFDPLISFHAADENSSAHMEQLFQRFERLALDCDVGIIIVHHMKKPARETDASNPASGVELRGSSAIHGAATNIMMAAPLPVSTRALDGKTRLRGLTVGFELKHSEPPDDIKLVCDRVSGRFYPRAAGLWAGDPAAFALDWGVDDVRYAEAFACPEAKARELFAALASGKVP